MLNSLKELFQKNREHIELMGFFWLVTYLFLFVTLSLWGLVLGVLATAFLYVIRHPKLLKGERAKKLFAFLKDRQPDKHVQKYMNALVAIYCVFLLLSLISNGVFLLPEQMLYFGLVGAFYLGKGKKFIRDWLPLVLLILAYEAMRGAAGTIGSQVHYNEMIAADKLIFGTVPTIYLQGHFFVPGAVQWYDVLATMIYMLHFSAPLVLAYLFWCEGREYLFRHISASIVIASYSGLIIFILFPAGPPWLAGINGYLPPVHKVLQSVSETWNLRVLWTVYGYINPNPVAAMPSLHAAFPWLVFLYIRKRWKNPISYLAILFPIAMAFSLIYLGEHYAIDVIAGVLLAQASFMFVSFVYRKNGLVEDGRKETAGAPMAKRG